MPLTVTFDTNTFDKVSRPSVYFKDPAHEEFLVVHKALKHGRIQGFLSDTVITLEGITNDERAKVFGNTELNSYIAPTSDDTFTLTIKPVQADRLHLHPKQAERFIAAFGLGIQLLGAPRIGMPRAEEQFYAAEKNPAAFEDRLNRFVELVRKIEARGLGSARAQAIAERLARGPIAKDPWFTALGAAQDIHETREVARAIAEWADADSVGAHYGYGNGIFCTIDDGKAAERREEPSVLDPRNRAWLTEEFAIQFATLPELAQKLRA